MLLSVIVSFLFIIFCCWCCFKKVSTLVEYYRQLAQKEKAEREKKKLTKRRNYMHLSVSMTEAALSFHNSIMTNVTESIQYNHKKRK